MNVLILGGTIFLGRHLVPALQERGHTVTLFNRGIHSPGDFPDVEKLRGNRDGNLSALEGRKWDAVVDTCGYVPRIVSMSARLLAPNIDRYVFISSVSVYEGNDGVMDEESPVSKLTGTTTEEITSETYGGLKYLCEQAAEEAMPGRVLVIRPGLIVGANDWSGRFAYWVNRAMVGGRVLIPDATEQVCQFIDVRDLAEWIADMVEKKATGVYNADGDANITFGNVLKACFSERKAGEYEFVRVNEEFLLENDVVPYREMPLWIPKVWGNRIFSSEKAVKDGLLYCRLSDTIEDIRSWLLTVKPREKALGKSLTGARERELFGKWSVR
ncbi:MAG: NAD-dependent epimerase/dehydratase family protein [Ignavibacteriae bacterium]|nr:NAD-dependent epimerase/dehydratase family protein [Ignavibacteriota bacterium]